MGAAGSGGATRRKGQSYRCFLLRCRLEEGAGRGGSIRVEAREPFVAGVTIAFAGALAEVASSARAQQ